jgi:hypothetical protein
VNLCRPRCVASTSVSTGSDSALGVEDAVSVIFN